MSIKYSKKTWNGPSVHKIYQHLPLQDTPKFTQIFFRFENKPSGNPVSPANIVSFRRKVNATKLVMFKRVFCIHSCQKWLHRVVRFFLGPNTPNWEKYTKWPQTIPNERKLYQITSF
jgi:hypothetical protein